MNKVQMITKNDCSHCKQLKMFLEMGLEGKYTEDIEIIHETENPEAYNQLKDKFQLQSAPAFICGDDVMRNYSPMATVNFLEKHIGAK